MDIVVTNVLVIHFLKKQLSLSNMKPPKALLI